MSRRASRPGTRSEPEPPELIVAEAFPEPESSAHVASAQPERLEQSDDDPVIPRISPSDDPHRWGDGADSNDQRLREGIPPHW